jgi:Family of unknown function (DUF5670)
MSLLELLIVLLLVAWLLGGVVFPVGTSLVHLILVIILILIVVRLLQGRSL